MNDPVLKDLLSYHENLNDAEFSRRLLAKVVAQNRKRRLIMSVFTVVGLLISAIYLWTLLPATTLSSLISPVNGFVLFGIGLFVVWLLTEELASSG